MNEYIMVDGELYHYGVLGMKWGVRRGNVDKAYAKARKKASRLHDTIQVRKARAEQAGAEAERKTYSRFTTKKSIAKAQEKSDRAQHDVAKRTYRAKKWVDAMVDTFKDTGVDDLEIFEILGKDYAKELSLRYEINRVSRSR